MDITARARIPQHGIRLIMEAALASPEPVIRLEVGEPDFPTPENIVDAAHRAARRGETRYTANAGIAPLREAIAAKLERVNGYSVSPDRVVVSAGGIEALFATFAALLGEGDQALIPDPAWPNFWTLPRMLGAEPVPYPLREDAGFLPDFDELDSLVTPRTKLIVINSPSNPVGVVFDRSTLERVAEFAERHDLWIVSDECYDQVVFDDRFCSMQAAVDSDRIVSAYTFSKTYAMTGWRIGYGVFPHALAPTITALQEPLIASVNTPAQFAALEALNSPPEVVNAMITAYDRRRVNAVAQLGDCGLDVFDPSGAFYLWVSTHNPDLDGFEIAQRLLAEKHVAVGPGPTFGPGAADHIRLSLASSDADLSEGIERIAESGLLNPAGGP